MGYTIAGECTGVGDRAELGPKIYFAFPETRQTVFRDPRISFFYSFLGLFFKANSSKIVRTDIPMVARFRILIF